MAKGNPHRPNKTQRNKRRKQIIDTLSKMSQDGWDNYKSNDYQPLERELEELTNG